VQSYAFVHKLAKPYLVTNFLKERETFPIPTLHIHCTLGDAVNGNN